MRSSKGARTGHRPRHQRLPSRSVRRIAIVLFAALGGLICAVGLGPASSDAADPSSLLGAATGGLGDGLTGGLTGTVDRTLGTGSNQANQANQTDTDRAGRMRAILALVNDPRSRAGCQPLHWDDRLATAAAGHSADMANRDYFDHISPDGQTPWDRAHAAGYPRPGGENIAAGNDTFDATMTQWMASPSHRANILNCKFVAVGVGEADGGSLRHYWTQMFGYE